jgi:hypothetical protein
MYADPPASLWSSAIVQSVMEQCGNKSVISGETRPELLCVFNYFMARDFLPTPKHLVIVTSREAQSISKAKTQEERNKRFPEYLRAQMEQIKPPQ